MNDPKYLGSPLFTQAVELVLVDLDLTPMEEAIYGDGPHLQGRPGIRRNMLDQNWFNPREEYEARW